MFRPSTAPRWKRHTRTAEDGAGRRRAYTARPRNSGSRPRLNRARPPDLTNALRETVMGSPSPSSAALRRPPPSLPLKLRAPEGQANGDGPRRPRIADIGQLSSEDVSRMLGHRAAEHSRIHVGHQAIMVARRMQYGVKVHLRTRQPSRGEGEGGVHAAEQ